MRERMRNLARRALLVPFFLAVSSCTSSVQPGYVGDDKKAVERAIEQFHDRFNSAQYQEIYDDAQEVFKQSKTKTDLLASMQETAEQFGRAEEVSEKWINVIVGAPVQIRAIYNTRFTKNQATETFVFIKDGDHIRLAAYQIYLGTVKPSESPSRK